mgnify:CR=1 FL=1
MKTLAIAFLIFLPLTWLNAQQQVFATELTDLDGNKTNSWEIIEPGTTTLLVFWKSSSAKCCDNLENLQSAWTDTLKNRGVKLIAICVDCNGSWSHIKPMMAGKNWDFESYIDLNGDFRRMMGVTDVPCTMLLDQNQSLLCRYNGFCNGGSELICEKILKHIRQQAPELVQKPGNQ